MRLAALVLIAANSLFAVEATRRWAADGRLAATWEKRAKRLATKSAASRSA
jgi:hypothetical protein